MDPDIAASFERQIAELRARVQRLEELLRSRGLIFPQGENAPLATSAVSGETRVPASPVAQVQPPFAGQGVAPQPGAAPIEPPRFSAAPANAHSDARSLESRVGSQWFNRVGILAILIGMAWFLKLAIDNHWIGPLGRVLIGLLAGTGMIVWSERFRVRGYAAFSYSLKAVGSGILYLSLWAAYSLYHLLPGSVAFAAMIAVTACNGFLAWIQKSELLALYAIVGGLSAPILVSTGQNHEVVLFAYLLMLDVAVLLLVALEPWSRLLFGAFLGTVLYVSGWWFSFYAQAYIGRTAFFLACFFLIFAFAPRLVHLDPGPNGAASGRDLLVVLVVPVANAVLGFVAFYGLFEAPAAESFGPWLALMFAAFYLLLVQLPATARIHKSPPLLSSIHLSTAVVFLTIAIPLKAHGRWLTIGWLAEGAALLWTSARVGSRLLFVLATLCLGLGLCALLVVNPEIARTPFFNARFGTYLVAIGIFASVVWVARQAQERNRRVGSLSWAAVAATALVVINLLALLAASLEIHGYWLLRQWTGDYQMFHEHQIYEQFCYSAFFMVFGSLLLAIGFWRRSAFFRWQALVLLAISVAKVFLVDVSALSQGFRILSFLGLGALLLAVSFVYQRDWLNLRSRGGPTP
jgi:uncharacterized membrane protein